MYALFSQVHVIIKLLVTYYRFDIDMVSRQPHEAAMNQAIEDVLQAFRANVAPVPVEDGVGGVYFFRTKAQRITAVFKPMDEEPFAINNPKNHRRRSSSTLSQAIRNGIAPGSAAIREVVAYLLDHEHRANVPSTVIVNATHPAFDRRSKHSVSSKCGSMQLYVRHECSAEDISESLLSIDQIHAIAILDIRLVNQDRHGGNLLVTRRDGPKTRYVLTPIDHGGCLPRITCMDETQFTWSTWSHADCPFNTEMKEYIASLDTWADTQRLINNLPLDHQLELDAWLTLEVGTVLLQVCVLEYNMTAAMIGRLMIRGEIVSDDEQSILERLVHNSLERSTRPHNVVSPLDPTWRLYVHHLLDEFRIELREWIHATKYI